MRMRRQILSRSIVFRSRLVVLAIFVALLSAAAPPQNEQPKSALPTDAPPLVQPLEIKAEHLATLSIAAPFSPRIGPWSALSAVYVGASLDAPLWNLRGAFSTRAGRIDAGTGLLFLTGFGPSATMPLMELTMLQAGDHRDCWNLINTDELRRFPKYFLEPGFIRDRRGIFNGDLEYEAYWQLLVQAHYTSAKAFARAARRDVTYVHLFNEPERYRGEVVHLSGRLVRLLAFPAPDEARAAGVSHLYEAWIMTDTYGENPVCVAFTDLPAGLKADNERKYNDNVGFDGYFYKRYRYKAADSKKANEFRDAPLLIGHTLTGQFGTGESSEEESWGQSLIWIFMGVVGSAMAGVLALMGWFRYHDRRVRHRLRASRNREFVPPSETEPRP